MEYFYNLLGMSREIYSKYTKEKKYGKWVGRPTHAATIEGEKMHFGLVEKPSNTGSTDIYHPNEQFIYVLQGELKVKIAEEERIIGPSTLVHVPPNVVHGTICVSEKPCLYITVKDTSWGLEALPKDMTIEQFENEVNRKNFDKE